MLSDMVYRFMAEIKKMSIDELESAIGRKFTIPSDLSCLGVDLNQLFIKLVGDSKEFKDLAVKSLYADEYDYGEMLLVVEYTEDAIWGIRLKGGKCHNIEVLPKEESRLCVDLHICVNVGMFVAILNHPLFIEMNKSSPRKG